MHRHHVPGSRGRKLHAKASSAAGRNIVHGGERFVGDVTTVVQDLCLKLHPLELIAVVVVQ